MVQHIQLNSIVLIVFSEVAVLLLEFIHTPARVKLSG